MKSPCFACHRLHLDKGDPECTECPDRLRYIAALGLMTHSVPDKLCDYRSAVRPIAYKEPEKMVLDTIATPAAPDEPEKKVCRRSSCIHEGVAQPLSNFDNNYTMPDNKAWHCKDCRRDMQRARSAKKICPSTSVPIGTRICHKSTCVHGQQPQPLASFATRARYCNDCRAKKKKVPEKSTIKMIKTGPGQAIGKIKTVDQNIAAGSPVSAFKRLADLLHGQQKFSRADLIEVRALCVSVQQMVDTYICLDQMLVNPKEINL